jgi:hypothetical protein
MKPRTAHWMACAMLLSLPAIAQGQPPCEAAVSHATDCQRVYCPLDTNAGCSDGLQELIDALTASCEAEHIATTLESSCAGLASRSPTSASPEALCLHLFELLGISGEAELAMCTTALIEDINQDCGERASEVFACILAAETMDAFEVCERICD